MRVECCGESTGPGGFAYSSPSRIAAMRLTSCYMIGAMDAPTVKSYLKSQLTPRKKALRHQKSSPDVPIAALLMNSVPPPPITQELAQSISKEQLDADIAAEDLHFILTRSQEALANPGTFSTAWPLIATLIPKASHNQIDVVAPCSCACALSGL